MRDGAIMSFSTFLSGPYALVAGLNSAYRNRYSFGVAPPFGRVPIRSMFPVKASGSASTAYPSSLIFFSPGAVAITCGNAYLPT